MKYTLIWIQEQVIRWPTLRSRKKWDTYQDGIFANFQRKSCYTGPKLEVLNKAAFLDPRFKLLRSLSEEERESTIAHIEEESVPAILYLPLMKNLHQRGSEVSINIS